MKTEEHIWFIININPGGDFNGDMKFFKYYNTKVEFGFGPLKQFLTNKLILLKNDKITTTEKLVCKEKESIYSVIVL